MQQKSVRGSGGGGFSLARQPDGPKDAVQDRLDAGDIGAGHEQQIVAGRQTCRPQANGSPVDPQSCHDYGPLCFKSGANSFVFVPSLVLRLSFPGCPTYIRADTKLMPKREAPMATLQNFDAEIAKTKQVVQDMR
ncbi:MAG: hypothetical protein ABJB10_20155, partial [Mesorhizobium sp.]